MFYHFDVDRWIIHQLPPILRRTAIYAFLRVFMYPLKQLAETFYAYKLMVDRQLSFNGITDIVEPVLSLSFIGEGYEPVYMSFDDEEDPASFVLASWPTDDTVGQFVVHVPESMSEADIATVRQWVDYYKFAGTLFTIETYE